MIYNRKKERGELMRAYSRKKESIKSILYLMIGAASLYLVSGQIHRLKQTEESVTVSEEVQVQESTVEEQNFELRPNEMLQWEEERLDEEKVNQLVSEYLLGGDYLKKVELQVVKEPYQIHLTYGTNQYSQMLSKSKKDQMTLLDASVLMSLYPDVDVVRVTIWVGKEKYDKVIYRPDLEDYFGIGIAANEESHTFERIAKEFMNQDKVTKYWNRKKPYDSNLGEEVENYFKLNFPVIKDEKDSFVKIDENLEQEVVEKYGCSLFLQGLKYKNPLMNYYSAYRLIEYYTSSNREQIMLQLATCQTKTNDERVKKACQKIIDLLSKGEEDGIRLFGRFEKMPLEGGNKLYKIDHNGLVEWVKWNGSQEAGLKLESLSGNKQYMLCEAKTLNRTYNYVIPVNKEKAGRIGYTVNESGVFSEGEIRASELTNLLSQKMGKSYHMQVPISYAWYYGTLLKIKVGEENYLYNAAQNILVTEEQFNKSFSSQDLKAYMEENFEIKESPSSFYYETEAVTKKWELGQEKIILCEYSSQAKKNMEQIHKSREESQIGGRRWSKGRLIVHYFGNHQEIINALDQMMG